MTQPPSTVPKLAFVLPPSADGASFETFRAASAPHAQIDLPDGARAEDFFVEVANWQLPHAMISRVRSCAQHMRRGPAEIAADAAPTMQLYLHVAGMSDVACGGRQQNFGPGDIAVYDSGGGYDSRASAFDVCVLQTARDRVPAVFLPPGVHGLKLPGEAAGTRIVAAALETLVREIDGLGLAEADHAVAAIWQVTGGMVAAQLARSNEAGRDGAAPMLAAALAHIGQRLTDPDLGPESLRAHLGLSRSAAYRLFAPLGGIETVIRQRRLDASMRALLTEAGPRPPLRALAARHGFGGEAVFLRAFQARFGTTPAQLREKIEAVDHAWLQAQARRAGFPSLEAWLAALTAGRFQPT